MKKIILSTALLFILGTGFSQSFMHGAGITVVGGVANGGDLAFAAGLTYSPRFNFLEMEKSSISVGVPLVIGFSGSYEADYNSYSGSSETNTLGFVFNAPLLISYNLGRGSTKENKDRMGYFAGVGYGFHHGDFYQDNNIYQQYSANTHGPAANAGVRFGVGRSYKNIEVRLSFMKGISANKPTIVGIAGLFNF